MSNIDVYNEINEICVRTHNIVKDKHTRIDDKLKTYDNALHSIAGIARGAINQLKEEKKE